MTTFIRSVCRALGLGRLARRMRVDKALRFAARCVRSVGRLTFTVERKMIELQSQLGMIAHRLEIAAKSIAKTGPKPHRLLKVVKQPKVVEQTNPCFKAPDEVWLSIAQHLPLVDQASPGFASKRHYQMLDGSFRDFRRAHWTIRLEFFRRIADRYPEYVLCPFCIHFNRWKVTSGDRSMYHLTCTSQSDQHPYNTYELQLATDMRVSWGIVQIVMRAYRHGPDYGVSLDDLPRSGPPLLQWSYTGSYRWVTHSSDKVIAGGKLLVRIVGDYRMPTVRGCTRKRQHQQRFERKCEHCEGPTPYERLCRHSWNPRDQCVGAAVRNIVKDLHKGPAASRDSAAFQAFKCTLCASEYQVDRVAVPEKGDTVRVTRWTNLGDGKNPFSDEWNDLTRKGHAEIRSFPLGELPVRQAWAKTACEKGDETNLIKT